MLMQRPLLPPASNFKGVADFGAMLVTGNLAEA